MIDRSRPCDKVGETMKVLIAWCLSLSESAYLGRHNQLAKIVHQQISMLFNLLCRTTDTGPEPVMEAPNVIVYWDRSIITDKTTDFNRPDTVLIDIQNKTTLVIDTAVPLNHNLPKTVTEEITKNENLALEIRKFWRLNNHSI